MSTLQRAAFRKKGSKNQNRATNRPVHSTRRAGARGGEGGGGPHRGGRGKGTGKAAGDGGEKGEHWKGQRTELTKRNSLTEDTPRDAVTNALRLFLHNFAYKTFKINVGCLPGK